MLHVPWKKQQWDPIQHRMPSLHNGSTLRTLCTHPCFITVALVITLILIQKQNSTLHLKLSSINKWHLFMVSSSAQAKYSSSPPQALRDLTGMAAISPLYRISSLDGLILGRMVNNSVQIALNTTKHSANGASPT